MPIKTTNGCVDPGRLPRDAKRCMRRSSPVQKLCDLILCEAAKHSATQIRIAISEQDAIVLEYEVNGEWQQVNSPPRNLLESIVMQYLLVNEFGPDGIPIVSGHSDAVANVTIDALDLKIQLPKDS